MTGQSKEKRQYWERRVWDLLRPLKIIDLLILSWAIEAYKEGDAKAARQYVEFPSSPDEFGIKGRFFIPPWSIDAIIREKLLLLGEENPDERRLNLRSWKAISTLFNTYNGLSLSLIHI